VSLKIHIESFLEVLLSKMLLEHANYAWTLRKEKEREKRRGRIKLENKIIRKIVYKIQDLCHKQIKIINNNKKFKSSQTFIVADGIKDFVDLRRVGYVDFNWVGILEG
jgi:hypothetical protein